MDDSVSKIDDTGSKMDDGRSFADFFAEEIAPGLPELEEARKERLRASYTRAAGLAFVIAVVAGIAVAWSGQILLAVLVAVTGLLAGFYFVRAPGRKHRSALRDLVVEPLRRFLGGIEYHRDPGKGFELSRFTSSGVITGFNRAKLEDLIVGRYRDTDFRMVEARLRQSRRSSGKRKSRKVFSGLLCEISVPRAFSCSVLLVADKGSLGNWAVDLLRDKLTNLSPVPLDHEAFEERYQVYSDQPDEALVLLQPAFLDSLLAITNMVGRKALNCAFMDGRFLIAIPQDRNLFEIGRLHRSLDHAEEDVRRLAAEFTLPHRLIDTLHGERPALGL
ncbi:DUF3137 domain-containing protein [Pelagibius sp.]|uniref:DUF3137 domain-containing protein n=1 Tax=Pelagibius sp. TaxID=1931238 RepID=UPI003BAFF4FD